MKKLVQELMTLGLSEKESQAYLALVQIKSGTAYKVAKHSGMKRSNVYLLLEELRKKGLVIKVPHTKNQIFTAKNPDEFFYDLEESMNKAKSLVKSMLDKQIPSAISAQIFEGEAEVQDAFDYKKEQWSGKEVRAFYGVPKKGSGISKKYYDYYDDLASQKTKIRAITSDHPSLKKFQKLEDDNKQEVIKLSPKQYAPKVSVEFGEGISKIYLHTAKTVLVVEGNEFADFLGEVFELIWMAKK